VRWGLIPSWVNDPRKFSLLINARAESVLDKPAFRAAVRRRRCIFPADGFYEWKQEGSRKQPYFIQRKGGGPFAIAGIWETWTGPNGEEVETAALMTTDANRLLHRLHDRMPAVLTPETFDMWLDATRVDADIAASLLRPAPEAMFEIHPVSTAVNRTANDTPELIAPVIVAADAEAERIASTTNPAPPRKTARDDGQTSLF
jgi:putative SOS response-associated peptidase YedK